MWARRGSNSRKPVFTIFPTKRGNVCETGDITTNRRAHNKSRVGEEKKATDHKIFSLN